MFLEEITYSTEPFEEGTRRVDACVFAEDEFQRRRIAEGCGQSGLFVQKQDDLSGLAEVVRDGRSGELAEAIIVHVPQADARMLATLAQLDSDLADTGKWIVVITTLVSLDDVFGCLGQSTFSIQVRPSEAEQVMLFTRVRAVLSATVVRELEQEDRLAVIRLTEQVEALMRNMSNWGAGAPEPGGTVIPIGSASAGGEEAQGGAGQSRRTRAPLPDPRLVRAVLRQRQKRNQLFGAEFFADPAWDMLLDLTAARAEHQRVSVTSLCLASGVPATTALRWIGQMVDAGMFQRVKDTEDGRRAFIELTDRSVEAMTRYFADLAPAEAMAA
ncbi:winged helix DNA-binding protein [Porphyrobacter sp. GA68]|uniref:winged helix DNA-binding protein n=1 Tax=Porphyrobacter sp. GA68 TaxID=2883480 RepID=UPI001D17EC28|nr:winged helix DNA-binding protein [Porphyrobacter sp. GA68]